VKKAGESGADSIEVVPTTIHPGNSHPDAGAADCHGSIN
jgi:hypothetical protein